MAATSGADVYHSGTVAAVREAALHGRPGIAFSHYRKRGMEIDWPRAIAWLRRVLVELLPAAARAGTFWNVNLPHLRPTNRSRGSFLPAGSGAAAGELPRRRTALSLRRQLPRRPRYAGQRRRRLLRRRHRGVAVAPVTLYDGRPRPSVPGRNPTDENLVQTFAKFDR